MIIHALRISQCRNKTYGLRWFIMHHNDVRLNFKHTIHTELDLLTSNDIIIKSRYYDFNDTTSIVNMSV